MHNAKEVLQIQGDAMENRGVNNAYEKILPEGGRVWRHNCRG